jgi:sec-independent protein translocase protein TatA
MIANLAWGLPGGWEWIVILAVALLIFGSRLPEVGRSIGRSIVEFKKGLKGVKDELDEVNDEVNRAGDEPSQPKQLDADRTAHSSSSTKTQTHTGA